LHKVAAVLSPAGRARLSTTALFSLNFASEQGTGTTQYLAELRHAVNERRRSIIDYSDSEGRGTERTVKPLGLWFWGKTWTLAGWCELREDFRNFRVDRVRGLEVLDDRFELVSPWTLEDYARKMREESR
jgi:predicted DNA-binding transcriptional regulator YafY